MKNISLQTDFTALDDLLAINLDVSLWTARKKLSPEDIGTTDLPPEELASLGSKRVADPKKLCIFGTLKARAVALLEKNGIRFMSGWTVPESKAGELVRELVQIRNEFNAAKEAYLLDYDQSLEAWIAKHQQWGDIIRNSTVSSEYVRSRMDFKWQLFRVSPVMQHTDNTAVLESGLCDEINGLGNTLFGEVASAADEMQRCIGFLRRSLKSIKYMISASYPKYKIRGDPMKSSQNHPKIGIFVGISEYTSPFEAL